MCGDRSCHVARKKLPIKSSSWPILAFNSHDPVSPAAAKLYPFRDNMINEIVFCKSKLSWIGVKESLTWVEGGEMWAFGKCCMDRAVVGTVPWAITWVWSLTTFITITCIDGEKVESTVTWRPCWTGSDRPLPLVDFLSSVTGTILPCHAVHSSTQIGVVFVFVLVFTLLWTVVYATVHVFR